MSDLSAVLIWWLTIGVLGIIFFPLTSLIFNRFIDKGYLFAKIIAILLCSYIMWLLASLHLLPFARISLMIIMVAASLFNLWLYTKIQKTTNNKFPVKWIIFEEILFLVTLSFWSYVRAMEPSIRGLEKFMDYGFVNSILRSTYFPPLDMWLTKSPDYTGGFFINYYYFGHYVTAFLTKLSGIDSAITYNLAIAVLFAFTFCLSFSLGANLGYLFLNFVSPSDKNKKSPPASLKPSATYLIVITGLLAAFLVALAGNPHTLYSFTEGYPNEEPVAPWTLSWGFHPERYWYPNATRFIANTIHEFPIYSFVVADLHGHVSDIPFVLLILALLLNLITSMTNKTAQDKPNIINHQRLTEFSAQFEKNTGISLFQLILLGLLIAVMYMTNAWDGVIYLILSGFVLLYLNWSKNKENGGNSSNFLLKTFSSSLFLFFFFLLFSFPFSINIRPFASGLGVLCAPKFLSGKNIGPFLFEADHCQKSPIYMMIILWGFFYYAVLGFFAFVILPKFKEILASNRMIPESARMKIRIYSNIKVRLLAFIRVKIQLIRELTPIDVFILILIFISTLLLIFPEFFYLKDIYPAHYRANTMFKLGYQAFMMLGLVAAYTVFRLRTNSLSSTFSFFKIIYNSLFVVIFLLVAIYPYFAINSYYNGLRTYTGLYGLNWLRDQFPDDHLAIVWLRENIFCQEGSAQTCNNQPVIVEANGESYTDYARVSANTGLPTIVGWPVHEWLWRGSYDEAGKRIPEVEEIYQSKDLSAVREILKRYQVEYIFVGDLEREKYPTLDEEKFPQIGKIVFESGNTRIYKVNLNL